MIVEYPCRKSNYKIKGLPNFSPVPFPIGKRLDIKTGIAYKLRMKNSHDAIVLFSGGLDSLLAAKVLEEQGLKVLCAHYYSPFFGSPQKVDHWQKVWNLTIRDYDISSEFCKMLTRFPRHGFGSVLNPCVDCKILILTHARALLNQYGARLLATGEVLGQRPMSQRRDTLDIISNEAGVKDILLRPLCAKHLKPTPMELQGLVDRDRLHDFQGRGRNDQLALAEKFRLSEIPSPAGGCVLTEKENGRRYWQIIKRARTLKTTGESLVEDFRLAKTGRQLWLSPDVQTGWLCIGRNSADNKKLLDFARPGDVTLKLCEFSGPVGLARDGRAWPPELIEKGAQLVASYSRQALREGKVKVSLKGYDKTCVIEVPVVKDVQAPELQSWENVRKEIRREMEKG